MSPVRQPGASPVRSRKRANNGSKAVHLPSEMISGMEGEMTEDKAALGIDISEAEAFDAFLFRNGDINQGDEENDIVTFTNFSISHFVDEPNNLKDE